MSAKNRVLSFHKEAETMFQKHKTDVRNLLSMYTNVKMIIHTLH